MIAALWKRIKDAPPAVKLWGWLNAIWVLAFLVGYHGREHPWLATVLIVVGVLIENKIFSMFRSKPE